MTSHEGRIATLAVSPDGRWLASGGHDQTARLWNLSGDAPATTATVLRGHGGWVECMAFSPDSRWLVTGGRIKTLRVWDLDLDHFAERLRLKCGRGLTSAERVQYKLD